MPKSIQELERLLSNIEGQENQTDRREAIKAEIDRLKGQDEAEG